MRKFIIIVLFCLGLFVVHQWALSQDESTTATAPTPVVTQAEAPALPPSTASLPGMMPPAPGMGGMGMPQAPMMGGDPRFAAEMRTQLTMQLREISQLLGRVDPRDTQFIETLRQEQALILEQLKSFEAPATPGTRAVGTPVTKDQVPTLPQPGIQRNGGDPRTPFPPNGQMSQEEIAKLIAEAQQTQANRPLFNPQPQSPYPPQGMGGMPAPFGGGTPAFGTPAGAGVMPRTESFTVPPQAGMPWGTAQSSQEITELKDTISTLQQQVEQMRGEIKALENQMRLLNQNILHMMNVPVSR